MTPQRLAAELGLDPACPAVAQTCAELAANIDRARDDQAEYAPHRQESLFDFAANLTRAHAAAVHEGIA